jgi:uncharacterized protein (DUF983 family)
VSTPVMDAPAITEKASAPAAASRPRRNVRPAIGKGSRGRCPARREGKMFRANLKVNDNCPHCGEDVHHHRAEGAIGQGTDK